MNVLVIPEDFRKDQYILAPIIKAMFNYLGKPKAKVAVCRDPLLGGVHQALRWETIAGVIDRYKGMIDIFVLCVDRDGILGRKQQLGEIERSAATRLEDHRHFFAENAWQELEVWVLAGHDLPKDWKWVDVRQEVNPKETYYVPYAKNRGLWQRPGEGRVALSLEAARRYERIRGLCPEDIGLLESRIRQVLERQSREL
ncbi:hypothetical protein CEB3_c32020 [Peptococcaceae bacterium CEB3]|nr:hypothetical protein CEB3_c32020 [Peptococcaceae bacterium CEB3]